MGDLNYSADVSYVSHYFDFCTPALIDYVACTQGFGMPRTGEAFTYCDIGCGTAKTLNVLAAANPHGRFVGIDISREHIAEAGRLATAAGNDNVTLLQRDVTADWADLPEFDYAVMHGFISWVSPEIRLKTYRLLGEKLKPGGRLLLTYNVLPGAQSMGMLRHFLNLVAGNLPEGTPVVERAKAACDAARFLRDNGADFFAAAPVRSRVGDLDDLQYAIHEYFTSHSQQFYFSQVAAELADVGLHFAGALELHRNQRDFAVPAPLHGFHDWIKDPTLRETVKDFIVGNSLRRDVFVKARREDDRSKPEAMANLRFCLLQLPDEIAFERKLPAGVFRADRGIHMGIITQLADGAKTFDELCARRPSGMPPEAFAGAMHNACAFQQVFPCTGGLPQPERTAALNRCLLGEPEQATRQIIQASTGFGGGYPLPYETAFLLAAANEHGELPPDDLARAAAAIALGQRWYSAPAGSPQAEDAQSLVRKLQGQLPDFLRHLALYRQLGLVRG